MQDCLRAFQFHVEKAKDHLNQSRRVRQVVSSPHRAVTNDSHEPFHQLQTPAVPGIAAPGPVWPTIPAAMLPFVVTVTLFP